MILFFLKKYYYYECHRSSSSQWVCSFTLLCVNYHCKSPIEKIQTSKMPLTRKLHLRISTWLTYFHMILYFNIHVMVLIFFYIWTFHVYCMYLDVFSQCLFLQGFLSTHILWHDFFIFTYSYFKGIKNECGFIFHMVTYIIKWCYMFTWIHMCKFREYFSCSYVKCMWFTLSYLLRSCSLCILKSMGIGVLDCFLLGPMVSSSHHEASLFLFVKDYWQHWNVWLNSCFPATKPPCMYSAINLNLFSSLDTHTV